MDSGFHIGINVFVVREEKLLLGKRKNIFGAGEWGLPGGHLEIGEKFRGAAARELKEETGMSAEDFLFQNLVNQHQGEKHYVQIAFRAVDPAGEPELCEPDRCEEWSWFDLDKLPDGIFSGHKEQVQLFKAEQTFSEDQT